MRGSLLPRLLVRRGLFVGGRFLGCALDCACHGMARGRCLPDCASPGRMPVGAPGSAQLLAPAVADFRAVDGSGLGRGGRSDGRGLRLTRIPEGPRRHVGPSSHAVARGPSISREDAQMTSKRCAQACEGRGRPASACRRGLATPAPRPSRLPGPAPRPVRRPGRTSFSSSRPTP